METIPNGLLDIRPGVHLLVKAFDYAKDVSCVRWQFAVEIAHLLGTGITVCDCRWLICKEFMQHAYETTSPESSSRQFETTRHTQFTAKSCFVLTDNGYSFASKLLCARPDPPPIPIAQTGKSSALAPHWDRTLRILTVEEQVVKRFRVPAPNQELILSSFEEVRWADRVDDPLPLAPEIDPKRRVQAAIMSLNRNQRNRLIHFRGDGRGLGIVWELIGK